MVEQVAADEEEPDAAEARRLAKQRGLAALVKRFFVLHGGKVVAFTVWWAAIQRPGAIGWLLTGESTYSCPACLSCAKSLCMEHFLQCSAGRNAGQLPLLPLLWSTPLRGMRQTMILVSYGCASVHQQRD